MRQTTTVQQVSVSIPPELWAQFRHACLDRKVSSSSVITLLIQEQLARWQKGEGATKKQTHL
jgi:metal-responsive CopG/Arc/MetJ family transcriptional regulator